MKFKNIKKKHYKKKSPSNSRSIPEHLDSSLPKNTSTKLIRIYRGVLKFFVVIIFIITAISVDLDLQNNLQEKQKIDLQREVLTRDLKFWKEFIAKNNNFVDAYFQASILEYKLGDISMAKMYVKKGLSLDPNSDNGRKIEKSLNNYF
jgi:hypothetical protein